MIVSVAPVSVLIVNKGDQLVVGEPSDIVCRSSGSRPPAHITWYLDGKRVEGGTESVSSYVVNFFNLNIYIYFYVPIVKYKGHFIITDEKPFKVKCITIHFINGPRRRFYIWAMINLPLFSFYVFIT